MSVTLKSNADGTAELLVNGNKALTFTEDGAVGGALPFSFRNKIINGNFDIWQRGTSASGSGALTTTYAAADRWTLTRGGGTTTLQRQAFTVGQTSVLDNPKYYLQLVSTSTAGIKISQPIEGVSTLSGKTAILSFYAWVTSGTLSIVPSFDQYFGGVGSPSTLVTTAAPSVIVTTTPTKYAVPVSLPSIVGKTLSTAGDDSLIVRLSPADGSYTLNIAQVQLEEGTAATDFEDRPIGLELALCQRYYEAGNVHFYNAGVTEITVSVPYKVTKRATPTVTSGIGSPTGAMDMIQIYRAASNIINTNWTASAEL